MSLIVNNSHNDDNDTPSIIIDQKHKNEHGNKCRTNKSVSLNLRDQVSESDFDNGWTQTVQTAFEEYRLVCQEKQLQHLHAQVYFSKWYRWTTYPVLFFASVISVLASMNVQATDSSINYLSLTIAICTGIHTLGLAFMNFVEYGKRSSNHNLSSVNYASVERYILSQILLKPSERDSPKFDFEVVSREFDAIAATEPPVPVHIQKKVQDQLAKKEKHNIID